MTDVPVPTSGHAYVAARIDGKLTRINTSVSNRCDHTATICELCASMWGVDYTLLLERTVAGRRLRNNLELVTQ